MDPEAVSQYIIEQGAESFHYQTMMAAVFEGLLNGIGPSLTELVDKGIEQIEFTVTRTQRGLSISDLAINPITQCRNLSCITNCAASLPATMNIVKDYFEKIGIEQQASRVIIYLRDRLLAIEPVEQMPVQSN